jgi:FAD/FMN-containing dehydrogenase/Fe-S oxidoreductase
MRLPVVPPAKGGSEDPPLRTPLPPSSHGKPVDTFQRAADLQQALTRVVRGEVRFDRGSRALYASDASNYRQVPIGVVVPRDAEDVAAAVGVCREFDAPILPRGAGTSLAGQSCNVAVVIDFTKYMDRVVELNAEGRYARVQPGVVLDTLRERAEQHHLTFGPDPSTHSRCTLGGMIGNNSCGTHSLLAGKTVDNVEELTVLLYDGTVMTVGATTEAELESIAGGGDARGGIYRALREIRDRYQAAIRSGFPDIPRRVSGYNLEQLLPDNGFHVARSLVGTEGTCALVLEAKVRLIESPPFRSLVGLGYADTFAAADHVMDILPFKPIGLEGFEGAMIDGLKRRGAPNLELMPEGRGYLLVEFGGSNAAEAQAQAEALMSHLARVPGAPAARLYTSAEAKAVWKIRESGPRAASNAPGQPPRWEGWDDAAVAPEKLGSYLRELRELLNEFQYDAAYYGHFGHGCIHMQTSFDLQSEAGIRKYADFIDRAADIVVRHGGSISGEHGDGQARGALLPKMFGPELMDAFHRFKRAWDPGWKMNPGKLLDAYPPTENLRLGADFAPAQPATHFAFPDDNGSFAKASMRCIGLGECRKDLVGTMCPSYQVTREEAHSTRGRARMLWEMLQGEAIRDGWNNEQVKESLDLCLSCKACKSECPTNVDIATYRAEFLSHYYEQRARPLHAHVFGKIDQWAKRGSVAPALANLAARAPGLRALLGIAAAPALPRLAKESFVRWARREGVATLTDPGWRLAAGAGTTPRDRRGGPSGPPSPACAADAILFTDTFNNYFRPSTAKSALAVLRHAGLDVIIPGGHICCGRPLYDFGFLDEAKRYLQTVMQRLGPAIDAGIPVIVLEPSCASVFRDELRNLFPADPRADRLRRQTFLLSEFLERHVPGYQPPALDASVLLHGHCHHQALMKLTDEQSVLRRAGATVTMPDAGCCGMAGPFGFQSGTYEVSQAIGERVLLPAVRNAAPATVIVSDGFSCRERIEHGTGRAALHLADVLATAIADAAGDRPQP